MTLSTDPAARIGTVRRYGAPLTEEQRTEATALLTDLLTAAGFYGVDLADFDGVVDLPGACVDALVDRDARKRRQS
jgi:hypothetical protein